MRQTPPDPGGAARSRKHGGLWVVQPGAQRRTLPVLGAPPRSEGRTCLSRAEGCGFDGHVVLFKDSCKPDESHGQPTDQFPRVDIGSLAFCRARENDFTYQVLKTGTFECKSSGFWLLWKNRKAWQGRSCAHVEAIAGRGSGAGGRVASGCRRLAGVHIRTPQPERCLAPGNPLRSSVLRSQRLQRTRIIRRPLVTSTAKSAAHVAVSAPWD